MGGMLAARVGDRKRSPRLALRVRIVPLFGEMTYMPDQVK